jgi:hypothetical protein
MAASAIGISRCHCILARAWNIHAGLQDVFSLRAGIGQCLTLTQIKFSAGFWKFFALLRQLGRGGA